MFAKLFRLLTVALVLAAPTAALAQKSMYLARFPAKFGEAAKLTRVAVLPFRGRDGAEFTSALVATLQSATFDGKPYFSVKTLDGMNFTPPKGKAVVNAETAQAITLGTKLGVDVVYIGEVTNAAISKARYTEERLVCPGNLLTCKEMVKKIVQCEKTTINYAVIPRGVRIPSGQMVYSKTVSKEDYFDQCEGQLKAKDGNIGEVWDSLTCLFRTCPKFDDAGDAIERKTISTEEGLKIDIRSQVAELIRRDVAPFNFRVTVKFKAKAPELPKDQQKKFKEASEWAERGGLDRACADWAALGKGLQTESPFLLYNLGVCQEVLVPEDPASALEYFVKSYTLLPKFDKDVSAARDRATKNVEGEKAINKTVAMPAAPAPPPPPVSPKPRGGKAKARG